MTTEDLEVEELTETEEAKQLRYEKRNRKEGWLDKNVLTESEVLLLKHRLNNDAIFVTEIFRDEFDKKLITREQTEKGLNWLKDQWKTPRGCIRKNNPFGNREISIIENFDHFTLDTFLCIERTRFRTIYQAVWNVYAKDGTYFQYWNEYSDVHIL